MFDIFWSAAFVFTFKDHSAEAPALSTAAPLWVLAAVALVTSSLGVGSIVASHWQTLGQEFALPPTIGQSGQFLGAALVPLLGLITPIILACVVVLQGKQLRAAQQQQAYARYEFAIETALNQRSKSTHSSVGLPHPSAPAETLSANAGSAKPPAAMSTSASQARLALQQTRLATLAAIRALAAAITGCELRLTQGTGETETLELQRLVKRLQCRLQLLQRDAARDIEEVDHE